MGDIDTSWGFAVSQPLELITANDMVRLGWVDGAPRAAVRASMY
jgi:hypothetical protein